MKHTNRNMLFALGLATSLVLPGVALADNWHQPSLKYSAKHHQVQRHDAHRGHDRDRHRDSRYAYRDRDAAHEWREHAERYYRYHRHHRHYGYGVYPSAFVSGVYVAPTPRLVIDLR